ncbi:hypothetical protein B0T26DRAFT_700418 [Lasiosphaeria miniovina]|uniref:Uncharacterized protein n=1 Tax=Lasiosphaeria miniovina TaxID=1954250 RepID=A0AA40DZ32_9PEZI|nr:uncharacterized protein B0T26DRAFT_700418 [Lasiosphaeria miniovina]KAK0721834.1 hypothetical protein B0T26DRAFT_700418 [Lasiosphaeria miniovina]
MKSPHLLFFTHVIIRSIIVTSSAGSPQKRGSPAASTVHVSSGPYASASSESEPAEGAGEISSRHELPGEGGGEGEGVGAGDGEGEGLKHQVRAKSPACDGVNSGIFTLPGFLSAW